MKKGTVAKQSPKKEKRTKATANVLFLWYMTVILARKARIRLPFRKHLFLFYYPKITNGISATSA